MVDHHVDIDNMISDIEFCNMMTNIFTFYAQKHPVGDTHVLLRLTSGSSFTKVMSETRRGEEYRELLLSHLLVKLNKNVGKFPGLLCSFRLTIKSKTSQRGHWYCSTY